MSFNKKFFATGGIVASSEAVCNTDSKYAFGADSSFTSNIALFQFEDNANDTTGNISAIGDSGVTYTTGYIDKAATFNGTSSHIDLPNGDLGIPTNNFTISLWFKSAAITQDNQSLFWIQHPSSSIRVGSIVSSSSHGGDYDIRFACTVGGTLENVHTDSNILAGDTWYHAVFIKSSTTGMSLYIDGQLVASDSSITGNANNNTLSGALNTIGAYQTSTASGLSLFFNGQIDQFRIFDREISASEVSTLYAETSATASSINPLNEGQGVALYNLDYDASDAGGLYDGTPTDVTFGVGGQINYGARFNGSSSQISAPNITDTSAAVSYSFWIKPNSIALYDFILGHQKVAANYDGLSLLGTAGNTLAISIGGGAQKIMTPSLTLGSWHHIVLTHDGSGNYVVYTNDNGSPITYSGITSNNNANNFVIGYSGVSGWGYYDGDIDQVRVFSSALTSTQVSTLYAEEACVYTATTTDNYFPLADGSSDAVAYYKLDNSAEDSVSTNDGTESGDVEYRFGRYGQAALFDGSSSIDTNVSIASSDNYSLSFWFKPTTNASEFIAGALNSSAANGFYVSINTNLTGRFYLRPTTSSASTINGNTVMQLDQWHHFAITSDSTTNKLYINGQLDGSASRTTVSFGSDLILGKAGAYTSVDDFTGAMDQVRFYRTALTSDQITELYNEKPETDTSNFKTVLYEGTSTKQYISNVGYNLDVDNNGDGGLVWVKQRTDTRDHRLYDTVRGIYPLYSSRTLAEGTSNTIEYDANGFFFAGADNGVNETSEDYVAWVWKGGGVKQNGTGTNVSSVEYSANTEAGFSIVKYTGDLSSSAGASASPVTHGLGAAPNLIMFKNLDNSSENWHVYGDFGDTPWGKGLRLNNTNALDSTDRNISAPDSTNFYTQYLTVMNTSGNDHIAYCFRSIDGYSKIGTYDGTGSSTNNRIYTTNDGLSTGSGGFKPSWIMIKNIDNAYSWGIVDNRRLDSNGDVRTLFADTNAIEANISGHFDFNDDGFTIRDYGASWANHSNGDTYIFMAFK